MTQSNTTPLIPADKKLPEITVKAVILSIILTVILAASNAYLALKVALTVSASIPASILSMGILRCFRRHNVLESNIVQTAASAGEALVAAIAFTLPALIVMRSWTHFAYWPTFFIALIGGTLGVFFSVFLRNILLSNKTLPFPEGTAIGNVLISSVDRSMGFVNLVLGGLAGGLISFAQAGLQLFTSTVSAWFPMMGTIAGGAIGCSPAILAAGYITGPTVGAAIFTGVLIGWVVGVPILACLHPMPAGGSAGAYAMSLWDQYIRYIGVGAMLVSSVWTLWKMLEPLRRGLITSVQSLQTGHGSNVLRTERDFPIKLVIVAIMLCSIFVFILVHTLLTSHPLGVSLLTHYTICLIASVVVLGLGFCLAAIAGYIVGLVGSSNSPMSGLAMIALLIMAFIIFFLLHFKVGPLGQVRELAAASFVIIVTSIIICAATITIDTIQDLKAGQMVGATPWRQQVMLLLGVLVSAAVIPLVMQLLFQAYGIGGVFPRPNMDPTQMLSAPQAGLMSALAYGVFHHNLPWNLLSVGGAIAALGIVVDEFLIKRGKHLPPIAIAIGIYIPMDVNMLIVLGGLIAYLVRRKSAAHEAAALPEVEKNRQQVILLACGLVAGSSLMGVLLAIPFVMKGSADALAIVPKSFSQVASILSLCMISGLGFWLYITGRFHPKS